MVFMSIERFIKNDLYIFQFSVLSFHDFSYICCCVTVEDTISIFHYLPFYPRETVSYTLV
jgi:hypothetical protein